VTVNVAANAPGSVTNVASVSGGGAFNSNTARDQTNIVPTTSLTPGAGLILGGSATQSSTLTGFPNAGAGAALDGNTNGNFFAGSVTATNLDPNAWWQEDLGSVAVINSIQVWNRTDCCGSRLTDYWVFVSDDPFLPSDTPASLQNRPGTISSHQTTAPSPSSTITFGDTGITGRYVRVQLTGTDFLSLAEVEVFGNTGNASATNIAQGKPAAQSSTYLGIATAVPASAVDGNTDGNFSHGSVTATNLDPNPWWQVDLGAAATVNTVVVWNRTDCCGSRLSDYWVFVSNTPFQASDTPATLANRAGTFASHQTSTPAPSAVIMANASGRYVRVQLSGPGYLSLAEVQVFGTGGAASAANLALGRSAAQSSTFPLATAGAASALDGNTDGSFFDGSVTATNLDPNPWWQVDLGTSASISSIVIWNRTDCCGSRLGDYWVFVSDTPYQASDTPASLQNRAGTFASHQTATPSPSITISPGAQGRYVRIQLSGAGYLSLAEVQVFGQ
jgi:hypothetical protein